MKKKLFTVLMVLVLALSLSVVSFAAESTKLDEPQGIEIETATGAEALAAMNQAGCAVLDLRAAEDYAKCHIKNMVSTPVCLPASTNYEVNTTLKQAFVDYVNANVAKTDKVYLVCYVGAFCVNHAASWLLEEGYENLYRVEGGVWNDADLDAVCRYADADAALKADGIILDVRATSTYLAGYVDKSLHHPLFDDNGVSNGENDALAKDFLKYLEANKEFLSSKDIYILCNSGSKGADAATKLLTKAGIAKSGMYKNVFTIEGGAGVVNPTTTNQTAPGTDAVGAIGGTDAVIIDVRTKANYDKGHLKGSISMPLFGDNGVTNGYDDLAQAFLASVKANKETIADKNIYVLCNSGSRGAQAATKLLMQAGYSSSKVFTITGGAGDASVKEKLTYVSADQTLSVIGNKDYVIIDVRTPEKYADGHLKGSLSMPLFDANGVSNGEDDLAKAFLDAVAANEAALKDKTIYILCNSGSRGAEAATKLLLGANYPSDKVFTIEGGANLNESIQIAFNNTVTADEALAAVGNDKVVIIDVRTKENYDKGHLKGSISMPLFDANGVTNGDDALAKAFLDAVEANAKLLEGKDIYILCNSGARGAQAATKLLKAAGYANDDIFTITGGAKNESIQKAFVTDVVVDEEEKEDKDKTPSGNKAPQTGDASPVMLYVVAMLLAAAVIVSKRRFAK